MYSPRQDQMVLKGWSANKMASNDREGLLSSHSICLDKAKSALPRPIYYVASDALAYEIVTQVFNHHIHIACLHALDIYANDHC